MSQLFSQSQELWEQISHNRKSENERGVYKDFICNIYLALMGPSRGLVWDKPLNNHLAMLRAPREGCGGEVASAI